MLILFNKNHTYTLTVVKHIATSQVTTWTPVSKTGFATYFLKLPSSLTVSLLHRHCCRQAA